MTLWCRRQPIPNDANKANMIFDYVTVSDEKKIQFRKLIKKNCEEKKTSFNS